MLNGIRLGTPGDAVLDDESLRVVGLEVICSDGVRRFLPLPAARIREDHVAVGSALILLEEDARAFYRRRSRLFGSLLGAPVLRDGMPVGALADLVIASGGTVEAIATGANGTAPCLHDPADVTITPARKASAA